MCQFLALIGGPEAHSHRQHSPESRAWRVETHFVKPSSQSCNDDWKHQTPATGNVNARLTAKRTRKPAKGELVDADSLVNKELWPLDPNLRYLNHGSFGATPYLCSRNKLACECSMSTTRINYSETHNMSKLRGLPSQRWSTPMNVASCFVEGHHRGDEHRFARTGLAGGRRDFDDLSRISGLLEHGARAQCGTAW